MQVPVCCRFFEIGKRLELIKREKFAIYNEFILPIFYLVYCQAKEQEENINIFKRVKITLNSFDISRI